MAPAQTACDRKADKVGTEPGISNWVLIYQKMIDTFADVTHDHQWIHIDTERAAAEGPFGGTIAH